METLITCEGIESFKVPIVAQVSCLRKKTKKLVQYTTTLKSQTTIEEQHHPQVTNYNRRATHKVE
jgi:hypothetical protein